MALKAFVVDIVIKEIPRSPIIIVWDKMTSLWYSEEAEIFRFTPITPNSIGYWMIKPIDLS